MKTRKEIPLNITFPENIIRLALMIPAGIIGVAAIPLLHTYLLVPLPVYLLFTALTYYSPVKHLYRIIRHRPVFNDANDAVLGSAVL